VPIVGETYVEVRADTSKFGQDLKQGVTSELDKAEKAADAFSKNAGGSVKSFGDQLKGGIQKAAIPAGLALAGIGALAKSAVGAASNLGESINAVNVTFGKASAGILQLSKDSATAVGLSSADFNSLAVQFSSFATKIAGPGGDVTATIESITGRAADFASVMNLEVADAARIFQSGLAGETEPLKRFGIDLSEAAVKAYAVANGIGDGTGKLSEQEKVLARHGALMEQTNKTQGDFANTSDGLANRQRILAAEMTNMKAKIGDLLVPAMEALSAATRVVVGFFLEHRNIALILGATIAGVAIAVLAVNAALKVQAAYTVIASAAQKLLNAQMMANPIGLMVAAIVVLIGAFVLAYKKIDWFRDGVNKVLNLVIGYFEFMINAWIKVINTLSAGINKFTGLFGKIGINIGKIGEIGEVSFGRIGEAAGKATKDATDFRKAEEESMKSFQDLGTVVTDVTPVVTGGLKKTTDAADKTAGAIKALRDSFGAAFTDKLSKAKEVLKDAQTAFGDFAKEVSGAVTSSFSFEKAYDTGAETKTGFIAGLESQAAEVKDFGVLVNRLIAANLSGPALDQVLAAGAKTGSKIATEILSTADGVLKANQLTAEVQSIGNSIGLNAATTFKQAGVTAGEALVAGIRGVISNYKIKLKSKALTAKQIKSLQRDFGVDIDFAFGDAPKLSQGGIFNSRQPAIIAEAGAEAVIPLSRPQRALELLEQSGLAALARGNSGATVSIQNATFVEPIDAQLLAAKVMVAERARSFSQ
jgi:hypothetical protein